MRNSATGSKDIFINIDIDIDIEIRLPLNCPQRRTTENHNDVLRVLSPSLKRCIRRLRCLSNKLSADFMRRL